MPYFSWNEVLKQLQAHVTELSKDKEFPIIKQITIGKASPNKEQLAEMNNTAKADKAYMEEMHLSTSDFINLKWIETVNSKRGANIDVMVGGGTNTMWNIKR